MKAGGFTIESVTAGSLAVAYTTNRAHVRGFVLSYASHVHPEGAEIRVHTGRMFGLSGGGAASIVSVYTVRAGRWVRASGTEVRGLEGLDFADAYAARYDHAPHMTRAYCEMQSGMHRQCDGCGALIPRSHVICDACAVREAVRDDERAGDHDDDIGHAGCGGIE
ncbi:MAG: hypothetical protein KA310_03230 [Pseudomonadales bacterium]|nr:hypothetical protein [Pseudomonadales bacterium]